MNDSLYKKISLGLAALFLAGCVLILANFWGRLAFPMNHRMFRNDGKENLLPGEPIGERFTALRDNLAQVNILMGNLDKVFPGETLTVSIRDAQCHETVRTADHDWPAHSPKQYDRWNFEPIPDSADKTYCLHILYDAPEKRKSRPYVAKEKKTDHPSDYFVNLKSNKVYEREALIFRPAYKEETAGAAITELTRRVGAYKADILKGAWLWWIFGAFLTGTLMLTLALLLQKERPQK